MEDWSFGDESDGGVCSQCGKRNRPGQKRCVICGTPLGGDVVGDQGALRTLGEAMSGGRGPRGGGRESRRTHGWLWPVAALALAVVAGVLYWLGTRGAPERHLSMPSVAVPGAGATAALASRPVVPVPTARGGAAVERGTGAGRAAPPPSGAPRVAVPRPEIPRPAPAPPQAERAAAPAAAPAPAGAASAPRRTEARVPAPPVERAAVPAPPAVEPVPRRTEAHVPSPAVERAAVPAPPPAEPVPPRTEARVPRDESAAVPGYPPARPGTASVEPETPEKPSVGTDLRDATRAYRAAIEMHNARVDEYNELADEIQRRGAWDDGEESVALRARLARARDAVESARAYAEDLRARMDEVRARYR